MKCRAYHDIGSFLPPARQPIGSPGKTDHVYRTSPIVGSIGGCSQPDKAHATRLLLSPTLARLQTNLLELVMTEARRKKCDAMAFVGKLPGQVVLGCELLVWRGGVLRDPPNVETGPADPLDCGNGFTSCRSCWPGAGHQRGQRLRASARINFLGLPIIFSTFFESMSQTARKS